MKHLVYSTLNGHLTTALNTLKLTYWIPFIVCLSVFIYIPLVSGDLLLLSSMFAASDEREKEGVARVIEALESNVWRVYTPHNTLDNTQEEGKDVSKEEDIDMDMFCRLIQEAKVVREEGKNMSDEARRERATSTALKMMRLLGLDDEGEE